MKISFKDINNWSEFKVYAESLPNKKARGDAFEHLTYLYFNIDPKYSFYDWVYKKSDVPQKDLDKLKLPRKDLGIDLIAKVGEEYHPIQSKYHEDKDRSVTFQEVSTFLAQLGNNKNFMMGYIASTANKTSPNYDKVPKKPVQKLFSNTWFKLDKDFFDKARKFEKKQKYNPKPFFPRDHQKKAIRNAYKHFIKENNSRGKLIFPCGAGKSLTGFWMMEKLNANSTIVAVPSLALIKQTLDVYLKEVSARNQKVKWLCICSDEGIGKNDDILYKTNEIGVPCNTDKEYIEKWLRKNRKEKLIIFTTYQSGRIIADISKSLKFRFDLGIFDEAHKTVGKNENLFSYLLFEDNISIKNRIFMTATERFYIGNFDEILTMDDPDDYGEVFSQMSFKEAIDQKLLTDYKIITIKLENNEIADFIKNNNLVKSNEKWGKESEARSLASMIALRKAMDTYPIKNAVSFHSSIEKAVRNMDVNNLITDTYGYKPINTYHVSGKDTTYKRESIIREFAENKRSLITNSRCLTEGVDVPNIDCILFADPRRSKVDIVQAMGRALRIKEGKKYGYVILPVVIDKNRMEPDNEQFEDILNIISGIAATDERLIEYFKERNYNKSKAVNNREEVFYVDPVLAKESDIINNINIKVWQRLNLYDFMTFSEAKEFVSNLNIKSVKGWNEYRKSPEFPNNMPSNPNRRYAMKGWKSWGDFLGSGNIATQKKKFKTFKEARAYMRSLKLKNVSEWYDYKKSGKLPDDIPLAPASIYKDKGWKGHSDFLGTGNMATQNRKYKSFNEARDFVRKLNLKSQTDWGKFKNSEKFPGDIPRSLPGRYKSEGWISWGDFLGTFREANFGRKYKSFYEARDFVRKLNLKKEKEWIEYCKSGKKPKDLPNKLDTHYGKHKSWKGINHFISGVVPVNAVAHIQYLEFHEARNFVRKLNLKSRSEWDNYCKSGKKPEAIPTAVWNKYKGKGWKSMADWLGYD